MAALKVVEEKNKLRIVHDATHGVAVNHRIKVRDQARSPTAEEIKALMREKYETHAGCRQFMIVGISPRRTGRSRSAGRTGDGKLADYLPTNFG